MAAAIKMDELLVTWLSSDGVFESIMNMVEAERKKSKEGSEVGVSNPSSGSPSPSARRKSLERSNSIGSLSDVSSAATQPPPPPPVGDSPRARDYAMIPPKSPKFRPIERGDDKESSSDAKSPTNVANFVIPPLLSRDGRKSKAFRPSATPTEGATGTDQSWATLEQTNSTLRKVFTCGQALPDSPSDDPSLILSMSEFVDITKDVCHFPSFFNSPLYRRIMMLHGKAESKGISYAMFEHHWKMEMEPFDEQERFFRLVKKPGMECITREDFLPFIEELLASHPGLEFLSNHAEFQEKYAVTVITRIFYSVCRNGGYNGKITLRQIRRSNLLEAMHLVDTEDDINKVTQYFSYEHFYVLYCRFWELDHDRDYLITREDLLKYGDHSLSHMIVDRIFDAAPRPFESSSIANINAAQSDEGSIGSRGASRGVNREYLSYEDFIFFMLSEEDKANEISVRYWFTCVDVDGDGKLNNMEMRSLYAVQLHRMQCLGHEIVPFEDMLCQMMDMIKPSNPDYFVVDDFLQPECAQVSGALFDALFNLNKYLQFEQRDPFMERQKREDEFECDWDRFACIDYNRLAMEEEAREEEAMEIDWVTVDEDDDDGDDFNSLGLGGASEAPF